jgi:putative Mg2+ transporter-C (MgtC) family protein
MERDSVAMLERVVFTVTANKIRHSSLLQELKESDATDQVVTFRDIDDE